MKERYVHLKYDKPLTAFTSRENHLTYLLNRFHGAKHMYVLNISGECHGRNTVLQELRYKMTPQKKIRAFELNPGSATY